IALIAVVGAAYESIKDVLAMDAARYESQYLAIGVVSPSVIPKLGTFRRRALSTASMVSRNPRPKLMAIRRSFRVIIFISFRTTPPLPVGASASNPKRTRA